jgi:hypothetical protein
MGKKEYFYELKKIESDKTIVFNVMSAEKGEATKLDTLLKNMKEVISRILMGNYFRDYSEYLRNKTRLTILSISLSEGS